MTNVQKDKAASIKGFFAKVIAIFPDKQVTDPRAHEAIKKALLFLYARQTADEQATKDTKHANGMGFSGIDAEFLSSLAEQAARRGLSPKQAWHAAKRLQHYSGQLIEL